MCIRDRLWTTNITEIGRSIKTPLHGDTFAKAEDYVCKAILAPSKTEMGGENMLIELDLDLRQSDKMSAFTGYKLSRKKKSWPEAENYCKTRGLQLATIHSEWEQELAEKAADGQKVWLGGRKIIRAVSYTHLTLPTKRIV